ncbi:MAG TPA: calcium-binding protein, partial [Candidatus Limnocylindrales bacterium]|nr:calcium-binding protein [Candidatus Limnocylindrales bacterium]
GKFEYQKLGSDLVIGINGDADGSITLRGFRDGDFGIHLWSGRLDPTIGRNLEGDRKPEDLDPNTAGEQLAYDNWGNVVTGVEPLIDREDALFGRDDDVGDAIAGGGGNDIIFGDTPMMSASGPRTGFDPLASGGTDWLDGGSGRDFIDAGPGDDLVEGGFGGSANGEHGGDVIQGGLGDDTLYGNFRGELGAAIRSGETDASSPLKGDFLSGGAGEDWLIGADASDVLVGGGGRDVLVGGAGDDTIRGDDGQGATTLLWTVTRSVRTVDGQDVYEVGFTGTNFFDFSAGAADTIYAGAGEDWVFAEAGDDFVDGGSGNDVLFGGAGADIVLGSTGNDVIVGDDGTPSAAEGGDYLDGADGDDTIYGNGGDDIIVGGRGNDCLVGGAGKDVYLYDKGDGRDVINDSDEAGSAASVIQFGPELLAEDVRFGVGSLKVYFPDGGEIHIEGFDQLDPSRTPVVGELRFEDGQVMSYADILAQGFDIDGTSNPELLTGTGVVDRMRGLEGNDVLIGFDGDDFLYGGDGSDTLHGGAGDDCLDGGEGFDNLYGGVGDDTYVYDTFDTINDSEGVNRIVFNAGITPESLSVSSFTVGGQPRLLIERPGTPGPGLDIRGASLSSSSFVYAFAEGRTLTQTELLQVAYFAPQSIVGTAEHDSLSGFAGNDDLSGGAGDDVLSGGGGDD